MSLECLSSWQHIALQGSVPASWPWVPVLFCDCSLSSIVVHKAREAGSPVLQPLHRFGVVGRGSSHGFPCLPHFSASFLLQALAPGSALFAVPLSHVPCSWPRTLPSCLTPGSTHQTPHCNHFVFLCVVPSLTAFGLCVLWSL